MKETRFPTLDEALYLYSALIERFGGCHGIRDCGMLESALARPRSGYYASLSEQAAALMHSLSKNHCFLDGNKRMAFALTAAFLFMNGYALTVDAEAAEKFMLGLAGSQDYDVPTIAAWLEQHMLAAMV